MIAASVQINPDALRKFDQTLNELAKKTRMRQPQLVAYAAGQLIAFAMRSSPLTRIRAAEKWSPPAGRKNRATGLLEPPPPLLPDQRLERVRIKVRITGKGFLKSGWARAGRHLREAAAMRYGMPGPEFGDYDAGHSGDDAWMEFHNSVPYIEEVMSGSRWSGPPNPIGTSAMNGARHSIKRRLQTMAQNIAGESGFRF